LFALLCSRNLVCGKVCLETPLDCISKFNKRNRVILGVRPEDIKVYLESKENAFLAQLVLVEKMDKYTILSLSWQGQNLKAIVERNFSIQPKRDSIWFHFDMDRVYLFDRNAQELLK